MSRRILALFATVIAASMILGACAPAAPQTIEVTRVVEGTPQVQVVTATPDAAAAKPAAAPGSIQLNGAGATFPLPVYTEWIYAYQYIDPSVVINYQGIGSGGGKKAIIDGTVDFAGSDSFLKDEEYEAGKDLQMYPVLAGAVVPIYNVSFKVEKVGENTPTPAPLPKLVLDRETLVGIYNAKITMWNDPAIVALNPGLANALPAAKITVVHRSDGSGTTEIFTKALTAFSADWTAGGASAVEWPVDKAGNGIGGKGNPGVAAAVQNTPNSIGYVELSYAVQNSIAFADMVNKAGKTVTANAESLASAMNDFAAKFSDKLTNTIVDGEGEKSWPISGYTYLILHTTDAKDCVKAQKVVEFFNWALTDAAAANRAAQLGYSVLPADVQTKILAKLGEVTCEGKPVVSK
ncbi:MAG: phosphate ABC transporter substrate-binding protein PstS [Anaerolineae bacterium]|nr:phosphate ABC transporter substrate-binding protein PstS [Anaerolineae bacterium]